MARSLFEVLTTPPPRKPPPPKYPLFTKKFHSTTSFSPGHIFGAAALGFGIYGLVRFTIERSKAASEQAVREASRFPQHPAAPGAPTKVDEPKLAQVENQRGQYGAPGARP